MIELRWLKLPYTTTKPARLQYRVYVPVIDIHGHLCPGDLTEWQDVPTVVESDPIP